MRMVFVVVATAVTLFCFARPEAKAVTVPFVGCPADGQMGPVPPPKGPPKVVSLRGVRPRGIAYYTGDMDHGVFAPRGWHCRVWYGSAGTTLVVTPGSIDSAFHPPKLRGHAVEFSFSDGGTSGRFSVAIHVSRLFPKLAATYIARVKNEGLVPVSEFERGPYTNDAVRYLASGVAEFATPGDANGLGTEGMLTPDRDPIRGLAILHTSGGWDMTILRVRLGAKMRQVEASIIQLNEQCMKGGAC